MSIAKPKGVPLIEQHSGSISYLQFDHFQQFPEIIHGVFTRKGGHSNPPFASLNTGRSINGDNREHIARNRSRALQALQLDKTPAITLWQVHSSKVITYTPRDEWRTDWAAQSHFERKWTLESIHRGDALITQERGVTLALSFADCVPIVFHDPVRHIIGIAHGGWRGTARGIVLTTIAEMHEQFGCRSQDIYAGIGPAIGDCCYEVSEQVHQHFMGTTDFAEIPTAEHLRELVRESAVFSKQRLSDRTSLRLNLQATNYKQLLMAGVPAKQIEVMEICTSCNTDRFFSHRAENSNTGRFAVVMSLSPMLS
jgi:YfiH family protein